MRNKLLSLAFLILLLPQLAACDLGVNQAVQNATDDLNASIAQLGVQSADWQSILVALEDKLVKDGQSTLRNEVADTLQRAEQAAASNIKCIIDFLRIRVQEDLIRIRDGFLKKPVDPPTPAVCSAVPDAIDLTANLNKVTIDGYNFDTTPAVQALLIDGSQTTNVSKFLSVTAQYELVLNVGTGGIPVSKPGQYISVLWKNTELSRLQVIETSPACQTTSIPPVQVAPITIIPALVKGDANFGGNGPHVLIDVYPSYTAYLVNILVNVDFVETNGGDTYASASKLYRIYTPPPGWKVDAVSNDATSSIDYVHSSSNTTDRIYPGAGFVLYFELTGFDGGNAAGGTAKVTLYFNSLTIERTQITGCHQP